MANEPWIAFDSTAEMLRYFEKNKGQIKLASIPQSEGIRVTVPGQGSVVIPGVGLILLLADGRQIPLRRGDAQMVLNDGILNRQGVTIVFA